MLPATLSELIPRAECDYTKYYCEENIWKLCGNPQIPKESFVVFISSDNRRVVMQNQSLGNGSAAWDYHVICICDNAPDGYAVLDLDSELEWALPFDNYMQETFVGAVHNPREKPLFRVVTREQYKFHFASDRSHMLKKDGSGYKSPKPDYPAIRTLNGSNTFNEYAVLRSEQLWSSRNPGSRTRGNLLKQCSRSPNGIVVNREDLDTLFSSFRNLNEKL